MSRTRTLARIYLAANLRALRGKRGVTQEQLAELAGVDLSFLVRVEGATQNVSLDVIEALARALDVTVQRLFEPAELPPRLRGRPAKKT